jgi:hypothetical protein
VQLLSLLQKHLLFHTGDSETAADSGFMKIIIGFRGRKQNEIRRIGAAIPPKRAYPESLCFTTGALPTGKYASPIRCVAKEQDCFRHSSCKTGAGNRKRNRKRLWIRIDSAP